MSTKTHELTENWDIWNASLVNGTGKNIAQNEHLPEVETTAGAHPAQGWGGGRGEGVASHKTPHPPAGPAKNKIRGQRTMCVFILHTSENYTAHSKQLPKTLQLDKHRK